MNRCDEVSDENITRYRRGLKALNPQAELIFEDAEGEIEQEVLEEDLPYDMKADVITSSECLTRSARSGFMLFRKRSKVEPSKIVICWKSSQVSGSCS